MTCALPATDTVILQFTPISSHKIHASIIRKIDFTWWSEMTIGLVKKPFLEREDGKKSKVRRISHLKNEFVLQMISLKC